MLPIIDHGNKSHIDSVISDDIGKLSSKIWQNLLTCYASKLVAETKRDLQLLLDFCCQSVICLRTEYKLNVEAVDASLLAYCSNQISSQSTNILLTFCLLSIKETFIYGNIYLWKKIIIYNCKKIESTVSSEKDTKRFSANFFQVEWKKKKMKRPLCILLTHEIISRSQQNAL